MNKTYKKYYLAKFYIFFIRCASIFLLNKETRRNFRNRYIKKFPILSNIFIYTDKNGKEHKFPYLKNINVEFLGCNNVLYLKEPYSEIKNVDIMFCGNNSSVEIDSSNLPITGLNVFKIGTDSKLKIGKNFSTRGCLISFSGEDNLHVTIGNDCMFSSGIHIQPTDSHSILDFKTRECLNFGKDVKIGNHCWICRNVTILKGTEISDNSVVASDSVVTSKSNCKNTSGGGYWPVFLQSKLNRV